MPTQEELNAARVELDIANDNYATLANQYNKYRQAFEAYSSATPEQQQRAKSGILKLLDQYNQLRLDMYTAEDRIAQAQSRFNDLSSMQQVTPVAGTRRRPIVVPEPEVVIPEPTITPEVVVETPVNGNNVNTNNNQNRQFIKFSAPKTVSQTAAEYNTYVPKFINNSTGTITNPNVEFVNPNLVTPYTPRPKRRISGYGWTY